MTYENWFLAGGKDGYALKNHGMQRIQPIAGWFSKPVHYDRVAEWLYFSKPDWWYLADEIVMLLA